MKKIYAFGLLLMTILLLNNLVSAVNISSSASTGKYVDITVDPTDGSTVKSLSVIKVTLPCIDDTFSSMLDYNEEVVPQIKVMKGDETVAEFNDFGDVMVDDVTNIMTIPIILSTTITEAGTYTIEIPEKAFVEKSWSDTDNAMVAVNDGWATPAYSGTVTVDPNAVSICDDYTLSPVSGQTVDQISTVTLTFNRISGQEYFSGWEFPNATFTNGEETIEAIINYDMTSGNENRVMTITPIDESEEPSPITAAGTWTMTIPAGIFSYSGESNGVITAEYTISSPKYADILVDPADGATVKSLSVIKVTLPCIDDTFESMLEYNENIISQISVKKGDEVVATFGEIGDPTADDEGNTIVPINLSAPVTESGTYTIDIPEKAFVEKSWSDTDNAMMPVKGGFVTPAYSGTVTVDPNMISVCDDYTLDPASGDAVDEISVVKVTFNNISSEEYFSGWEFPNATFSNGEKTIEAIVNYDWMSESENRVMNVTPIDESEEPTPITTAGTWTMTIAPGTFSYNGETNSEIIAEYTIAGADTKYADMLVDPQNGATVKTLSSIKVTLPAVDPNFESMLDYNEDVITKITVKNGEDVIAQYGEIGDPTADDEGNTIVPIILSAPVTEAGTYTIDIPEKAFVEKSWSDTDNAMMPVKGGFVTPAYSGTVTVDANMISVCDDYTLNPASGDAVNEISVVKVTFNNISSEEYFSGWEFPNATFSNGEKTIEAIVNYDWMSESENRVMTVTPVDESEEPSPITDAGTWTMTIAPGTFSYNGETNSEIIAEYTINQESSPYKITPESGTVLDNLSSITIEFPGATEIEYNEQPITLVGPEYNISSTDVLGTGNVRTVAFRNPSVDGEYTVTFPAGAFTIDGEASEVATATYTFRKSYVLAPESGSTLKSFEVALSFPNATDVEYNQDSASITLTNYSSYATPSINCVKDATASVPTFILTIPDHAQKPAYGNYDLIIEEGSFIIDGKASAEIIAKYFMDPEITIEYQISPDGTIIYQDYGYDFAIIFDESSSVRILDQSKFRLTLDGIEIPATSYESLSESNMLMFLVSDSQFCKNGVLKLNIAEGALSLGGTTMNPAIEAQWTLTAPKTFRAILTPSENSDKTPVNEIETIYVNFPDATSGEIYNVYGAYLRKTDYTYSESGTITKVESVPGIKTTGVTFAVTFPKAESQGTYKLSVREGTFDLDGIYASPEIEADYFVGATSGISDILVDENGNVTVYSVDGKLVLNNAPAVELNNVAKGIYIINGKKVVLK